MTLRDLIQQILGDEWEQDTFTAFYNAAEKMDKAGWSYELIERLLSDILRALRNEYGD